MMYLFSGESTRITLDYTHQVNYPMDLYFLMDGSKSMAQVKSNLSEVTDDVVAGLLEIFTDIQLGFGMFIDKPVLPYTDMNAWKYVHGYLSFPWLNSYEF